MTHSIKTLLTVTSAVFLTGVIFSAWRFTRTNEIPLPDEKAAAMTLLADKLSGPRYFSISLTGVRSSDGPWIGVAEAGLQEDRVIAERHWGKDQRAEVDQLLSRLAEPVPARMVGGYRIPLERLNLALDAIKD